MSDKIISSNETIGRSKLLKTHKLKLYDNDSHEPHNNLEIEEINQDIINCLTKL